MTTRLVMALRRVGGGLIVVWVSATVAFLVVRLVPGDPVDTMLGIHAQVSDHIKDGIRADLGLDRPLYEQYALFLGRLLRGDLGTSYQLRKPVTEVLGEQLGSTLQLTGLAMAIAVIVAVGLALVVRRRAARAALSATELVVVAAPTFFTGLLLLSVFGFQLGWFPVLSSRRFEALILPALTLALPVAAILGQVLRQGIDAAAREPFMLTALARGATPARLHTRHGFRHGATGAVALGGYLLGSLLGGAVLVETVFARPGLGRVALRAILDRDMPVVVGIVILSAVVFSIVNLLVDLAVGVLDPRTTRSRR